MVRFYPIADIFREKAHRRICRYFGGKVSWKENIGILYDIFMQPALLTVCAVARWRRSAFPVYAIYAINNDWYSAYIMPRITWADGIGK